ncbi:putative fad binding domain-containing protein [Seiridium cardinale]
MRAEVESCHDTKIVAASRSSSPASASHPSRITNIQEAVIGEVRVVRSTRSRTFKQGNLWGGSLYYFGDSFPGQLEALANELNKPDASKETHLIVSMGLAAMLGPCIICLSLILRRPATSDQPNTLCAHTLAEAAGDKPLPKGCQRQEEVASLYVVPEKPDNPGGWSPYSDTVDLPWPLTNPDVKIQLHEHNRQSRCRHVQVNRQRTAIFHAAEEVCHRRKQRPGHGAELGYLVSIMFLTLREDKEDDEKILD